MSTNAMPPAAAPMQPPADPGAMVPPQMMKSLDNIMGELGRLYQQCHMMQPDSPLCDAVMSVQKAMSEIGRNVGMPEAPVDPMADPAAADPMAGPLPPGADPMEMPPPPEAGLGGPPPDPMRAAAEETHNMILDDKKRRR